MSESAISTGRLGVKVPKFRSLKRVEKWCEKYFDLYFGCCFSGCDIDAVNPTIKQLVHLGLEFPEVVRREEHEKCIGGFSRR